MENNQIHSDLKKHNLEFSVTDFLNSDSPQFDFKPINDGLGFHKDLEVKPSLNSAKAFDFNSQSKVQDNNLVSQYRISPHQNAKVAKSNDRQVKVTRGKSVSLLTQAFSGIIDLLIVAFSTIALIRILSLSSSLQGLKLGAIDLKTHWGFTLSFFSIIWVSYSTFLSPSQTVGQSLAHTKLKFVKDPYMSSFIRSLVILSSFVCFLIPLLFDFQGKLSDTELINE
ncbi:MAG: hypothetical protein COW00_06180 [Bdellovibrio sp. CG12_big_fil_rev_8_21_14_0_65_39_13]|nr:MAG: hypothetical protein COW78_18715 [Bdellovibrio sp. CG22_combo_CG10-13_8_21_14_all_39_27]PIQ60810.1 MAG: hypothetical protein COW00_06180 [Bdellovibrio sp. CG12_big_fil_rev_8_21_14_0_65_39_13]PIR36434.1 MAG: hypothetical protein COV37_03520 [Bdellovibrio sp. CG11_big_fil_rev_8_21_14_0_20_39_38]PJB54660.1 MAG: hypothetical protein CO099_00310 [Bdellovibrio sp. CG_4_9_14_3_um_filter_39_7]